MKLENVGHAGSGCNVATTQGLTHIVELDGIRRGEIWGPAAFVFDEFDVPFNHVVTFMDQHSASRDSVGT